MEKKKEIKIILVGIYIVLIIAVFWFAFLTLKYQMFYEEAIKQGTENTITALQMVVACQQLSNITSQEIQEKVILDYIKLNKSAGED